MAVFSPAASTSSRSLRFQVLIRRGIAQASCLPVLLRRELAGETPALPGAERQTLFPAGARYNMSEVKKVAEEVALPKSESDLSPPSSADASVTGAAMAAASETAGSHIGRYRWVICALLF